MGIVYKTGLINRIIITVGVIATSNIVSPVPTFYFTENICTFTNVVGTGSWDYDDDSSPDATVDPVKEYFQHGTYNVVFTHTDTTEYPLEVILGPVTLPTATFTATPDEMDIDVDATGSTSIYGPFTYEWVWGDGTANGSGITASHTYTTTGDFVPKLIFKDALLNWNTTTRDVSVNDRPIANFTYGKDLLDVDFVNTSTDIDGIVSNAWDFDDNGATSSSSNPSHTFSQAGTYDVSLISTDKYGLSSVAKITQIVASATYILGDQIIPATLSDFSASDAALNAIYVGQGLSVQTYAGTTMQVESVQTYGRIEIQGSEIPLLVQGNQYLLEIRLNAVDNTTTNGGGEHQVRGAKSNSTMFESDVSNLNLRDPFGTMTTYQRVFVCGDVNGIIHVTLGAEYIAGNNTTSDVEIEHIKIFEVS